MMRFLAMWEETPESLGCHSLPISVNRGKATICKVCRFSPGTNHGGTLVSDFQSPEVSGFKQLRSGSPSQWRHTQPCSWLYLGSGYPATSKEFLSLWRFQSSEEEREA